MTRRKHEIPETGGEIPENVATMESVEAAEPAEAGESEQPSALMAAANAVHEGVEDAREAAAEFFPTMGKWMSKSVYGACYYASFGVVFGALTVARLVPTNNVMGQALRDGAEAAREAVEHRQAVAEEEARMAGESVTIDDAGATPA